MYAQFRWWRNALNKLLAGRKNILLSESWHLAFRNSGDTKWFPRKSYLNQTIEWNDLIFLIGSKTSEFRAKNLNVHLVKKRPVIVKEQWIEFAPPIKFLVNDNEIRWNSIKSKFEVNSSQYSSENGMNSPKIGTIEVSQR